ncbi:MAG: hypothetical protein AAF638_08440, partial [Pseudomonadota bacterium]
LLIPDIVMILVLFHPMDTGATALADALRQTTACPVLAITIDEVVYPPRIVQRLGSHTTGTEMLLHNGTRIDGTEVTGVINRVAGLPDKHLAHVSAGDRAYAMEELYAFILGWLAAFPCAIVNAPHARGLSGYFADPLTLDIWSRMAGFAGVLPENWDGDIKAASAAVAFDGRLYGPVTSERTRMAALRLQGLTGLSLCQIDMAEGADGTPWLVDFNPFPDSAIGGRPLLRDLATVLGGAS